MAEKKLIEGKNDAGYFFFKGFEREDYFMRMRDIIARKITPETFSIKPGGGFGHDEGYFI